MSKLKAFKYRIYPTDSQKDLINRTIGCSRFMYNKLLEISTERYNQTKTHKIDAITIVKNNDEFSFLKEVDKFALDNARINLDTAYKNFFRGLKSKNKRKSGKPKFKSKHKSKLTYKTNMTNNNIRLVDEEYIRLPKLGNVKMLYHRELYGDIKSVTVTNNKDGSYEISVLCDVTNHNNNIKKQKSFNELNVVGLDMSFSNFIVSSDGEIHNHPKYYRKAEKNLKKKQRSLSKKVVGSNNRNKAKLVLAKQHMKVKNQRKDFLHKLSRRLVNENDVIVLEDIDMSAMAKTLNLGKSVGDMGFGMFRNYLKYKSEETDTLIYYVDRFFASSQTCSTCGVKNPNVKNLSVREWTCNTCGTEHDRDFNAALNLKQEFEKILANAINTAGTAEIHACGDTTSGLIERLSKVVSLNQEALTLT